MILSDVKTILLCYDELKLTIHTFKYNLLCVCKKYAITVQQIIHYKNNRVLNLWHIFFLFSTAILLQHVSWSTYYTTGISIFFYSNIARNANVTFILISTYYHAFMKNFTWKNNFSGNIFTIDYFHERCQIFTTIFIEGEGIDCKKEKRSAD